MTAEPTEGDEMDYPVVEERAGYLTTQILRMAVMPRARFVEIVRDTLDSGETFPPDYFAPIRREMLRVALEIERFPFNTWLNPIRGCGCLAGEALVARRAMQLEIEPAEARAQLADFESRADIAVRSVSQLLREQPYGDLLTEFGNTIDRVFAREVGTWLCVTAIKISDEPELAAA